MVIRCPYCRYIVYQFDVQNQYKGSDWYSLRTLTDIPLYYIVHGDHATSPQHMATLNEINF